MPPSHCGTSEFQISIFDAFFELYKDKYDIFLFTNYEADEYHNLSGKYDNILYPDTITGAFHLGYAPNQLMFFNNQKNMNEHCLKIVQTMFDIIMTRRIDEFFTADMKKIVELGIKLSDGVVFISEFTQDDFKARYANERFINEKKLKVIYPATDLYVPAKNDYQMPFDKYFLIIGNMFEHKVIKETIEAVKDTRHNYIVIGYGESEYIYPNIFGYMNGHIDNDYLRLLYSMCDAVIYPSLYEGFGLPVVMSFEHGKRVVANNNALNNELCRHFHDFKDYFSFYDSFDQLPGIIDKVSSETDVKLIMYGDTWARAAKELDSFFEEVLSSDVDIVCVNERWSLYETIESERQIVYDEMTQKANEITAMVTAELEILYKQFGNYKLFPMLYFALKKHVKHRWSRLFKLLKRS